MIISNPYLIPIFPEAVGIQLVLIHTVGGKQLVVVCYCRSIGLEANRSTVNLRVLSEWQKERNFFVQIKKLIMQGQLETNIQVSFLRQKMFICKKAVVPCLISESTVLLAE